MRRSRATRRLLPSFEDTRTSKVQGKEKEKIQKTRDRASFTAEGVWNSLVIDLLVGMYVGIDLQ